MHYCTKQDLINASDENELIALTGQDNNGQIDDAKINQAISDASAEIDAYISRFLPLSEVPPIIRAKACDMARHELYSHDATERVKELYKNAINFLEKVAKGTVSLGLTESGNKPASSLSSVMQSDGRVFGRDDGVW